MPTKTSSSRSKSGTKRSTRGRGASKKQTEAQKAAHRQMQALILFVSGILTGAFALIAGTSFWGTIHNTLFGLFGACTLFVAVLLLYLAFLLTASKPVQARAWLGSLLIVSLCGALQIFQAGLPAQDNLLDMIVACIKDGVNVQGGGLVGALLGLPLLRMFDKLGAGIIIVMLIFLLLMLLTGGTLIGLIRAAHRPVKKLEEAYAGHIVSQEERAAQRAQQQVARSKRTIDIPLEGEKPTLKVVPPPEPPEEAPDPAQQEPTQRAPKFSIDIPLDDDFSPGQEGGFSLMPSNETMEFVPAAQPTLDELVSKAATDTGKFDFAAEEQTLEDDLEPPRVIQFSPQIAERPKPESQPPFEPDWSEEIPADDPFFTPKGTVAEPASAAPVPPMPKPVYRKPSANLLRLIRKKNEGNAEEMKNNAQRLVDTLASFGVQTRVVDISRGPAVTRYELQPSAGVKISRITGLADDIALNLASAGVRIEAPIPNKAAVGIEVPNKDVSAVTLREIIESDEFTGAQSKLAVALGRDIAGNVMLADIAKMPHLLIAGSTGSGKSVCINSIIMSLLFNANPDEVRFLMIDPKVVELGVYNGIPHLLVPVVTDPKKAAGALSWAVGEMMKRYKLFADNSVRDLFSYNNLVGRTEGMEKLPQVVIIIDELADLMMAAPNEIEDYICRLAQMARAAGMHLLIATQRPSVDVITGVIKANIPSRIAFAVSSQVDSRTILDMGGAEKLLGRGDMLFNPVGAAKPVRVQGCFVTDDEIEAVISFIKNDATADYDQQIVQDIDSHVVAGKGAKGASAASDAASGDDSAEDEMLMAAIACVVEAGMASTSLLQRRLKLGYARAARIVDEMEARGVVGPFEGSKPRQVLISPERFAEMKLAKMD